MIYLLDANSFIQAKNLHYRMHVVPGFWQWLTSIHPHHQIESIDPIYKELTKNTSDPDELHHWAMSNKSLFKTANSPDTQAVFAEIANYLATHPTYSQTEVSRFLSGADPWLIAAAKTTGAKIVTHEVPVPDNSRKVKIPNVAKTFAVEHVDIFDLLELSECKLVIGG